MRTWHYQAARFPWGSMAVLGIYFCTLTAMA